VWIENGARPLPRKFVITYKDEADSPQYTAISLTGILQRNCRFCVPFRTARGRLEDPGEGNENRKPISQDGGKNEDEPHFTQSIRGQKIGLGACLEIVAADVRRRTSWPKSSLFRLLTSAATGSGHFFRHGLSSLSAWQRCCSPFPCSAPNTAGGRAPQPRARHGGPLQPW